MATSALNPHAPIFVPSAYRAVEDFSDEWWDLVQSCPWFRDYWIRECFSDPQLDLSPFLDDDYVHDDSLTDNAFNEGKKQTFNARSRINFESRVHRLSSRSVFVSVGKESSTDLVALGWLKWRKPRGEAEMPRYCEKAPKFVNMKVKPRAIQQPR